MAISFGLSKIIPVYLQIREGIQEIESKSDYWSWRRQSREILRRRNFLKRKKDAYGTRYKEAYKYYTTSQNYTEHLRHILMDLHIKIG